MGSWGMPFACHLRLLLMNMYIRPAASANGFGRLCRSV